MPYRLLKVERREGIAIMTLNRPNVLNALCRDLLKEFEAASHSLKGDASVAGVIVTGSGTSFCAGADIAEIEVLSPEEAADFSRYAQEVLAGLESLGKPVIAAVNGHAIGGGLEVALACDFIIAADTASFAFPEIRLGIIPGFGGTQRLSRLVGKAMAKELIFTGNRIDADEAFRIGLANRIVPAQRLMDEALALMTGICARGMLSLRLAKEIIDAGYDIDLKSACQMERDAFALCFTAPEQKEGMSAFLEKRQPRFRQTA